MGQKDQLRQRLSRLEEHLRQENPVLQKVVKSFRNLDRVSHRMGFLLPDQSYALRTPWWPLVSILGTYSSGKSTFMNTYLGYRLQSTGNQAVDDKFTVVCYTGQEDVRDLPGMALDSDPRFPLYRIGRAIEEVAPGEGQQVDSYVQLKTCPSPKLKGKILIDSPGFDADAQRTSTLRITDRIVDLSDLVLIFFDARHPESGSMRDTLSHLVNDTLQRRDANKFLFILNQIDMTAGEDNPEEVFAAWQRALAQSGMTAGRTFSIYDPDAGFPIKDESLRKRFSRKADEDRQAIYQRMEQVQVERAYRIVGMLEESANHLEQTVVPTIARFQESWRRRVLSVEAALIVLAAALFLGVSSWTGYWDGLQPQFGLPGWLTEPPWLYVVAGVVVVLLGWGHFTIRRWSANKVAEKLAAKVSDRERQNYLAAFAKSSRWWRSIFRKRPVGWGRRSKSALNRLRQDVKRYIQELNDTYTNPSGQEATAKAPQDEEKSAWGEYRSDSE